MYKKGCNLGLFPDIVTIWGLFVPVDGFDDLLQIEWSGAMHATSPKATVPCL